MGNRFVLLLAALLVMMITALPTALADSVTVTDDGTVTYGSDIDTSSSDDDNSFQNDNRNPAKELPRYELLVTDNSYSYYLDTRTARWIPLPHSGLEYIIDAWIRVEGIESEDEDYSYPAPYALEHYYIRPDKQQIQFLCEFEVTTGRPSNTIKGRDYDSRHWEDIIPGSIDDDIYTGVIRVMNERKRKNPAKNKSTVRDWLEETLRISL